MMKGTIHSRPEARRLTDTARTLAQASLKAPEPHGTLLVRRIDEPQRRVIENVIRGMEQRLADITARAPSQDQHTIPDRSSQADRELVEVVASELIRGHGVRTISFLREFAEIADEGGDWFSAEAWRDIADAADRLTQILPSRSFSK